MLNVKTNGVSLLVHRRHQQQHRPITFVQLLLLLINSNLPNCNSQLILGAHTISTRFVPTSEVDATEFRAYILGEVVTLTLDSKIAPADIYHVKLINSDPHRLLFIDKESNIKLLIGGSELRGIKSERTFPGPIVPIDGSYTIHFPPKTGKDWTIMELLIINKDDESVAQVSAIKATEMLLKTVTNWTILTAKKNDSYVYILGYRSFIQSEGKTREENFITRLCVTNLDKILETAVEIVLDLSSDTDTILMSFPLKATFDIFYFNVVPYSANITFWGIPNQVSSYQYSHVSAEFSLISSTFDGIGRSCSLAETGVRILEKYLTGTGPDCSTGTYELCAASSNKYPVSQKQPNSISKYKNGLDEIATFSIDYPVYRSFWYFASDSLLQLCTYLPDAAFIVECRNKSVKIDALYYRPIVFDVKTGSLVVYPRELSHPVLTMGFLFCDLFKSCWSCLMFGLNLKCQWLDACRFNEEYAPYEPSLANVCFRIISISPKVVTTRAPTTIQITTDGGYTHHPADIIIITVGEGNECVKSIMQTTTISCKLKATKEGNFTVKVEFKYGGYKDSSPIRAVSEEMINLDIPPNAAIYEFFTFKVLVPTVLALVGLVLAAGACFASSQKSFDFVPSGIATKPSFDDPVPLVKPVSLPLSNRKSPTQSRSTKSPRIGKPSRKARKSGQSR